MSRKDIMMLIIVGSIIGSLIIGYLLILLLALVVIKYAVVPTFIADIDLDSDLYKTLNH